MKKPGFISYFSYRRYRAVGLWTDFTPTAFLC